MNLVIAVMKNATDSAVIRGSLQLLPRRLLRLLRPPILGEAVDSVVTSDTTRVQMQSAVSYYVQTSSEELDARHKAQDDRHIASHVGLTVRPHVESGSISRTTTANRSHTSPFGVWLIKLYTLVSATPNNKRLLRTRSVATLRLVCGANNTAHSVYE